MPTPYDPRIIPTTNWTIAPRTGDIRGKSWDESTEIWSSVSTSWDNWIIGTPATTYTTRIIP